MNYTDLQTKATEIAKENIQRLFNEYGYREFVKSQLEASTDSHAALYNLVRELKEIAEHFVRVGDLSSAISKEELVKGYLDMCLWD